LRRCFSLCSLLEGNSEDVNIPSPTVGRFVGEERGLTAVEEEQWKREYSRKYLKR
jgi:hypothetical protein